MIVKIFTYVIRISSINSCPGVSIQQSGVGVSAGISDENTHPHTPIFKFGKSYKNNRLAARYFLVKICKNIKKSFVVFLSNLLKTT
jgi:hypothetical protein